MLYIPLTSTPMGWLILGLGGYALYKKGKKTGEEEAVAAQITAAPVPVVPEDKAVETKGGK